jgi:hypothetical protein
MRVGPVKGVDNPDVFGPFGTSMNTFFAFSNLNAKGEWRFGTWLQESATALPRMIQTTVSSFSHTFSDLV